jgi:EAL and modified HD-GYP domain-containing signal transduction protein
MTARQSLRPSSHLPGGQSGFIKLETGKLSTPNRSRPREIAARFNYGLKIAHTLPIKRMTMVYPEFGLRPQRQFLHPKPLRAGRLLVMHKFIARQPILDRMERVYGYELLFRPGEDEVWPALAGVPAGDGASPLAPVFQGIEALIDGTRAFIKCPRQALIEGHVAGLPRDQVVLEIPAAGGPAEEIVNACRGLKKAGFTIALENYPTTGENPLAEFADIIKLDVTASADRAQWLLIRKFRPKGTVFIADKVETRAQFQAAVQQGYFYFQGQFFLRAQPSATSEAAAAKLVYLLVLTAVTRPEIDLDEVARTIKHDLVLSYKLLRFLNSARFAFRSQIKSIRHALMLLGQNEIRKWIGLVSVSALGEGGPPILVALALIRAAFCESFAALVGEPKRLPDYFFLGLLSSIDVLMRRPMRVIVGELPVAQDVSAALMGEKCPMRDVLEAVLHYEQGNWEECSQLAKKMALKEEKLCELHWQALRWSRELIHAQEDEPAAVKC